jgi:phage/plasmid-like protein (TIGR03299 family)
MAHEVETMAYANEVPWHGLGKNVPPNATVDEMLVAAGLDWQVTKQPLYLRRADGTYRATKRFALVRDSDEEILTYTSEGWTPFQNRDALNFFRRFAEAGSISLETAGSLRRGRVIWALAKINHSFEAKRGDRVNGYILLVSPHEVGSAISVRTTSVRVVCANTMALATRTDEGVHYRQNHMSEFDEAAARAAVERAHEHMSEAARQAKTLANLKLGMHDTVRFLGQFFGHPQMSDEEIADEERWSQSLRGVMESVISAPGADPGTGWGVLAGVTHWCDHVAGRSADARLTRSWLGDYARLKEDVSDGLMMLAS